MNDTTHIPSRWSAAVFFFKATGLQCRRALQDKRDNIQAHPSLPFIEQIHKKYMYVWSECRSPLWGEEQLAEHELQLGKVQNLRCALRKLHATTIPADAIFSFWKQIGQATRRRGYVSGRLLREGCLFPAVGGGLCQLSNALYEAALQAELEIVERHAHSQTIPGSAAQRGRDATVAWNYIDLRFRSPREFCIEAMMTPDELVVRFRGHEPIAPSRQTIPLLSRPDRIEKREIDTVAHSCATCGQSSCFRHAPPAKPAATKIAWMVDEVWPEYQEYLKRHAAENDVLLLPLDGSRWNRPRYAWSTCGISEVHSATAQALKRSFSSRRRAGDGAARLENQLHCEAVLSKKLGERVRFDVGHLVVAQCFLPHLWQTGILGGRTFDVFMTRLPLKVLHVRLQEAFDAHPERSTLNEFRAPQELVECEAEALASARLVMTPHSSIASLFPPAHVLVLPWKIPDLSPSQSSNAKSNSICFSGPTAARKGAYELREAARGLDVEVILCGNELEGEEFWRGLRTRRVASFARALSESCAVVQPAIIEDNPRRLLQALAVGIPVIATPQCGLAALPEVFTIPSNDAVALQVALATLVAPTPTNRHALDQ